MNTQLDGTGTKRTDNIFETELEQDGVKWKVKYRIKIKQQSPWLETETLEVLRLN